MAARIGIELAGGTCRIVELGSVPLRGQGRTDPRVTAFATLALTDPASSERFAALRGRRASVVVWTPHSTHRHVEVAAGPPERMRAEAFAAAGGIAPTAPSVLSDIAPAAPPSIGQERRAAIVAAVPSTEAADVLRPLRDAGIRIDAVLTPAAALTSLARLRGCRADGACEGYVALDESASTIAIIQDRHLVAARSVAWGFRDESLRHAVRPQNEIVERLAGELSMCTAPGQLNAAALAQIYLCGGLPDLRTMSVGLTELLDIEVETLDGLFGIDATQLPGPTEEFCERAAELRLAWATAADKWPTLDLRRDRKRRERRVFVSQAAIAAGVAVGLAGGWTLQERWSEVALRERRSPAGSVAEDRATGSRRALDPPVAPGRQTPVVAIAPVWSPSGATAGPDLTESATPTVPPGALRSLLPPLAARPPLSAPPRLPQTIPPPTRLPLAARPSVDPQPLPFEATLGSISPERKLAVVDGRIVGAGDEVRGARIVEVTPTVVYLRDKEGRLRSLTVGGSGR